MSRDEREREVGALYGRHAHILQSPSLARADERRAGKSELNPCTNEERQFVRDAQRGGGRRVGSGHRFRENLVVESRNMSAKSAAASAALGPAIRRSAHTGGRGRAAFWWGKRYGPRLGRRTDADGSLRDCTDCRNKREREREGEERGCTAFQDGPRIARASAKLCKVFLIKSHVLS